MADLLYVAGYALMWTSMCCFSDERLTPLRQVLAVTGAFALLFILAWQYGFPRRRYRPCSRSYTFHLNIFFLLVATAGLVLMAQERADRGVRTAGRRAGSTHQASTVGIATSARRRGER